jgi:hypothetical protein
MSLRKNSRIEFHMGFKNTKLISCFERGRILKWSFTYRNSGAAFQS